MQREIKFRGFHKCENGNTIIIINGEPVRGKWVYGYYYYDIDRNRHMIWTHEQYGEGLCDNTYEVIPETVGQYTGLKDKNGKEIYEGDVLSDGVQLWLVRYSKTMSGHTATEIVNKRLDFGSCFSLYHLVTGHNCKREVEVIGNIYENQELLKE